MSNNTYPLMTSIITIKATTVLKIYEMSSSNRFLARDVETIPFSECSIHNMCIICKKRTSKDPVKMYRHLWLDFECRELQRRCG